MATNAATASLQNLALVILGFSAIFLPKAYRDLKGYLTLRKALKKDRKSTIVEVEGTAEPVDKPVKSQFSGDKHAFCAWSKDEHAFKQGARGLWNTTDSGSSGDFILKTNNGEITVHTQDAELLLPETMFVQRKNVEASFKEVKGFKAFRFAKIYKKIVEIIIAIAIVCILLMAVAAKIDNIPLFMAAAFLPFVLFLAMFFGTLIADVARMAACKTQGLIEDLIYSEQTINTNDKIYVIGTLTKENDENAIFVGRDQIYVAKEPFAKLGNNLLKTGSAYAVISVLGIVLAVALGIGLIGP